jgi:hypothetical protein
MKSFVITRIVEEKIEVCANNKAEAMAAPEDPYSVLIIKETCEEQKEESG